MKHFLFVVVAAALTVAALAQDAKMKPGAAEVPEAGQTFPASAAILTAPMVLTNGYLFQAEESMEVAEGGKAVFNFSVANAGKYVIETLVNAPDESSNSFFLNVDAMPQDPDMIWDIDVTSGFEKRTVSWRGSGTTSNDEFAPKRFTLAPGAHQLIIVGREGGTLLKSLALRRAPPE